MRDLLKYVTALIALTQMSLNCVAQTDTNELTLTGVWQESPTLGSGWSANYQFFDDGRFHYNHNQMDCGDSILIETGTFMIEDGILYLDYDSVIFIKGAALVPSTGSCASEFELVGGYVTATSLEKSEGIFISRAEPQDDYDYLERILMDNVSWFRLLHNPEDY